jgi:tryptophan 7-halogenase
MSVPTSNIVIVGAGIAGWAAAAALARALSGGSFAVTVVPTDGPDDSIGRFGPAEPTLPQSREWQAQFGLDENALLRASRGTFALGVAYSGWTETPWFAPFGDTGAPLDGVAFHQLAGRLRSEGRIVRFADYSVTALAAQASRFARPPDTDSVLSSMTYGFQLERSGYAAFLQAEAGRGGVVTAAGAFAGAELDADGNIAAVTLTSRERVEGDLFLDCSGDRALLIEGALGTGFESWQKWLPVDRTVELMCESPVPPAPYCLVAAQPFGWRRTVPLQQRIGECLAFSSAHVDDETAYASLESELLGPPVGEPSFGRFEAGRRRLAWNRNCIAMGAAVVALEPVQSTALHLVQTAVARLIELFPNRAADCAEATEYNRRTLGELDRLRDFLILRYKTNGREGEPLWDELRAMDLPESAAQKLRLYGSRGRILLLDEESYEEPEWAALLDEHGIRPKRYDPLADAIPRDRLHRHFARIRELIVQAVGTLPAHADYVRQQCTIEPAA